MEVQTDTWKHSGFCLPHACLYESAENSDHMAKSYVQRKRDYLQVQQNINHQSTFLSIVYSVSWDEWYMIGLRVTELNESSVGSQTTLNATSALWEELQQTVSLNHVMISVLQYTDSPTPNMVTIP